MSLEPPKVKWYNEANTLEQTEWNVGVVDAGSYSRPDDPNASDDPTYPSTFLIWNNRYDAGSNPAASTTDVSDMTNVSVTTLSLVRDANGNIDPNLSYQPAGPVAGQQEAVVEVIFYDSSKQGGAGEWGTYDETDTVWQPNTWREVGGNNKSPVVAYSGAKGIIAGTANSANLTTDKANYAKTKMRLYVKPNATAGRVEWITRVSYQYEG
ncbi:MAG: hypothetical protein MJB12_09265 [Firmicutes bacterium]|nr:hypothetical protein [Bacillota bacterium]